MKVFLIMIFFYFTTFLSLGKSLGIYVATADFVPSKDAKDQIPMKAEMRYRVVRKDDSGKSENNTLLLLIA